jgi:hypothetical protein
MAGNIADTWKSRMGNIGLVVDLAGIDRLMTIRGNWDSKKGSAAAYPQPDLQFADELKPVIGSWRSCSNSREGTTPAPSPTDSSWR